MQWSTCDPVAVRLACSVEWPRVEKVPSVSSRSNRAVLPEGGGVQRRIHRHPEAKAPTVRVQSAGR